MKNKQTYWSNIIRVAPLFSFQFEWGASTMETDNPFYADDVPVSAPQWNPSTKPPPTSPPTSPRTRSISRYNTVVSAAADILARRGDDTSV